MPLTKPTLWVVATPLGNPGDLSTRAAEVLASVDFILAEDTRRAGLLCARCNITAPRFISFHDHNEDERLGNIINELKQGASAALVSDAGTPLCADPGYRLVRACHEQGIRVSPVPGPSAITAALSASGIAPQPFTFFGFLPRKRSEQERVLAPFATLRTTLIFFERKDRLADTLETARAVLGPRECCIARELTKTYEEFILSRLGAPDLLPENLLGEFTVIVGPPEHVERTPVAEVCRLLARFSAETFKPKDIARRVHPMVTGWSIKELYELISATTPSA